jgi:uncharacterized repeat protein (TIGR04138 family)
MAHVPDITALAEGAGGYDVEAFAFVGESLRHAARSLGRETAEADARHLTAGELVSGVLDLADHRFGLLADLVLRGWGINGSIDIGRITFALIEHGIFSKQPTDRIEDFSGGPDFAEELRSRSRHRLVAVG